MTPATAANRLRPDEREADCAAVARSIEEYWHSRGFPGIRVRFYRRPTGASGAPAGYDIRTNLGPDGYPPGGRLRDGIVREDGVAVTAEGPVAAEPVQAQVQAQVQAPVRRPVADPEPVDMPYLKDRARRVLTAARDLAAAGEIATREALRGRTGQSPNTVDRALSELTAGGYLEKKGTTSQGVRFVVTGQQEAADAETPETERRVIAAVGAFHKRGERATRVSLGRSLSLSAETVNRVAGRLVAQGAIRRAGTTRSGVCYLPPEIGGRVVLTAHQERVLTHLRQRAPDWSGQAAIAADTGLKRGTVSRCLKVLIEYGLVLRQAEGARDHRYRPIAAAQEAVL